MILQAPTTWINALTAAISAGSLPTPLALAGGGTNYVGLHLVRCKANSSIASGDTAELPGGTSAITALFNAGGRVINVPAWLAPAWLEIPASWANALSPSAVVTSGTLQLSQEFAADFYDAHIAAFQALGFTTFVPTVAWQVPTVNA